MYYLIFFGWLMVSATTLHASSLLGCLETKDGIVGQLAVVANGRGTYDITIADGNDGRLRYLAIDLACTKGDKSSFACIAAPSSPHAGSSVSVTAKDDRRQEVAINSPLTEGEVLVVEKCAEHHRRLPAVPPTKGCLAYFQGAYYNPDLGDCVAEQTSGCRNPYPYLGVDECRVAMHLSAE